MPFKCPSMPFQIDFLYDMILKGMSFQMPFQINVNYLKGHLKGHALQYHIIQKGNLKGHWRAFEGHCAKTNGVCPLKKTWIIWKGIWKGMPFKIISYKKLIWKGIEGHWMVWYLKGIYDSGKGITLRMVYFRKGNFYKGAFWYGFHNCLSIFKLCF